MVKSCLKLLLILMSSGLLIVNCSDDSSTNSEPAMAENDIGPEGGTIEIAGGIILSIPSGALTDTITFEIAEISDGSHPTGNLKPVSSMYSIEPSGTIFDSPATLTLHYDESKLGGVSESAIVAYTYEISSWGALATDVHSGDNYVTVQISHLSDFCAMVDTSLVSEGIYTKLVVARNIMYYSDVAIFTDVISAVFDSVYAPCDPIQPISGVNVGCDQYSLDWYALTGSYMYPEPGTMMSPFIQLGKNYQFTVTASDAVPALVSSIDFPDHNPYITSPAYMSINSLSSDLMVTWQSYGAGTVELILVSAAGDSSYMVETANDGSHLITSSNFSGLTAGEYALILNHYNREFIDAFGYDPRSFVAGRVISTTMIILQ